jgi:hypothetical protein
MSTAVVDAPQPSGCGLINHGARLFLRLGLFNQHHRDAVDDRIAHLAVGTTQLVWFLELHARVAFRARQDFEQFLRDHPRMVVRFGP